MKLWDPHGDTISITLLPFLFFFNSLVYVPLCLAAPSSNKYSPNPLGCDKSYNACALCCYITITNAADVVFLVNYYFPTFLANKIDGCMDSRMHQYMNQIQRIVEMEALYISIYHDFYTWCHWLPSYSLLFLH